MTPPNATDTNPTTTARDIGEKLVSLCKQGKNLEAIETLYDPNIVSVEPMSPPSEPAKGREVKGIAACKEKGKQWESMTQVHSAKVEGPFMHGDDQFAVYFSYDITGKQTHKRTQMTEVAVYTVKNGKVVHERFYYTI